MARDGATPGFKDVIRVCSGNLLEMYDFMVFGYYAPSIAATFFPTKNSFNSIMLTLLTFGAGFLMRPIGAIVLGAYTDRKGRRAGLMLSLLLMSIGTVSLAITPGYRTIGVAAPLLVLFGRLLQGFSAGAELGTVSVYLSEIAPPGRKGFYVSWQSASQQLAVMLAALIGVALSSSLSSADMDDWGWRVPLLLGCAIVPILFILRRTLRETDSFLSRPVRPTLRMSMANLAAGWRPVITGMMMVTLTTVCFYLITAYTPTLGRTELHLGVMDGLVVTLCVGASNFLWLPVMGALSDRIGRKPSLFAFTGLAICTAYPAMRWLVGDPSFARLLMVDLWLSFLFAGFNGAMVVYLTEIIPAPVRAAGFSLAYSLATAVFGGFTPAISTGLIRLTGDKAMPGLWLAFAGLIGLAGVVMSRRAPSVAGAPEACGS